MRTASKLSGAIVGAGRVAVHAHVPGWRLRDDVEIVGAADPRPEARQALEEALPPSPGRSLVWRDSVEALLDHAREHIDFVDICSPPAAHAPAIRAALERGVHVLCEKPLVLDGGELAALASLAASRGLVLGSVHNWRFAPPVAAATELVRSGAIGHVRRCRWEVVRDRPAATSERSNWRLDPKISGGGILIDHGWHAVYVVAGWMPGRLTDVEATLTTRKHHEFPVEDTADLRLGFGSGAVAEIFLTWAGDGRRNTVSIEGEHGTIRIDGRRVDVETEAGHSAREVPESLADGSHHPTWFAGVADELVEAIRSPESGPPRSLAEAALCVEALELARESSRTGGARLAAALTGLPVAVAEGAV
jgi:predicted dehydrogenase